MWRETTLHFFVGLPLINAAEIRERFKLYVGDERYVRFVRDVPASHEGTRLRFWMEREWERFEAENLDCELDFQVIVEVFGDCPDHGSKIRRKRYMKRVSSWLTDAVTISQLESKHGGKDVGFLRDDWSRLKSTLRDGDKLYEFRSPPETWEKLRGRQGIALVREGEVIDLVIMALN